MKNSIGNKIVGKRRETGLRIKTLLLRGGLNSKQKWFPFFLSERVINFEWTNFEAVLFWELKFLITQKCGGICL